VTPDFEFWVECAQDSEDPASAVISHRLTNISPKIIDDDGFNQVFESSFDDITFEFKTEVDVADLIDQLEELDAKNVELIILRIVLIATLPSRVRSLRFGSAPLA